MKIRGLIATTLAMAVFFCVTGCNHERPYDKYVTTDKNGNLTLNPLSSDTLFEKTMLSQGGTTSPMYHASQSIQRTDDVTLIRFYGYESDTVDSDHITLSVEVTGELRDMIYHKEHPEEKYDAEFLLGISRLWETVIIRSGDEGNDFYSCYLFVGEPDKDGNVEITLEATVMKEDKQSCFYKCKGVFSLIDIDPLEI